MWDDPGPVDLPRIDTLLDALAAAEPAPGSGTAAALAGAMAAALCTKVARLSGDGGAAASRPPAVRAGRGARKRLMTPPLASVPDLDRELDALYDLPLDQFTKARNDLATRLRKAHQTDAAAEVRGLRKPTTVAWAAN